MIGFSGDIPGVLPQILEDTPDLSPGRIAKEQVQQLLSAGRKLWRAYSHDSYVDSLKDGCRGAGAHGGLRLKGFYSFLLSRVYVIRERPSEAFEWQENAKQILRSSSDSARALIDAQSVLIFIQLYDLSAARRVLDQVDLRKLPSFSRPLVRSAQSHFDACLAYERGAHEAYRPGTVEDLGPAYEGLLLGRSLLQAGRYAAGLDRLTGALEKIGREEWGTQLRDVILLHIGRSKFQIGDARGAIETLEPLQASFEGLKLDNCLLATRLALINAHRVFGSRRDLSEQVNKLLALAKRSGVSKTSYHALLLRAALELRAENFRATRRNLESARKHLGTLSTKERCTLHMRSVELEYRQGRDRAARLKLHTLRKLLPKDSREERAIVEVQATNFELWSHIRAGRFDRVLERAADVDDKAVFALDRGVFRHEPGAWLLLSRLRRTTAYAAIVSGRPAIALHLIRRAEELCLPEYPWALRMLSQVRFLRMMLAGLMGDGRGAGSSLREIQADDPNGIALAATEFARQDSYSRVGQFLFETFHALRVAGLAEESHRIGEAMVEIELQRKLENPRKGRGVAASPGPSDKEAWAAFVVDSTRRILGEVPVEDESQEARLLRKVSREVAERLTPFPAKALVPVARRLKPALGWLAEQLARSGRVHSGGGANS